MAEETRQDENKTCNKKKRTPTTTVRIISLLFGCVCLLFFVRALWTGYLSWIGTVMGVIFFAPGVISPAVGLAGKKRLEKRLDWLPVGVIVLIFVTAAVFLVWPKGNDTWRPYRFDRELAALEGGRAVPAQENAALRYDSLRAAIDVNDRPDFVSDGTFDFSEQPWRGEDHPQASQWLDAHARVIDSLLLIGKMEKCRWPIQADMDDEWEVPHEMLRRSTQLLVIAGNRDLGEGRIKQALQKYFSILGIAHHLYQQRQCLDFTIGFSHERTALRLIGHALVQTDLSEGHVDLIGKHLPSAPDPWLREWPGLLECEKLRYMNILGRIYQVNQKGDTRFAPSFTAVLDEEQDRSNSGRVERVARLYWLASMPLDPQDVRSFAEKHFARFDRLLQPTYLPLQDETPRWGLGDLVKVMCNRWRWGVEAMFFDGEQYIDQRCESFERLTRRRGTWLVLGLRRYRNAHGRWPDTLEAVSAYVPAEALDDPTGNEAFVYRVEGDRFRLHSKGFNRIDDAGRHGYVRALKKSEDDIPIWPPSVTKPHDEEVTEEELAEMLRELYGEDYLKYMQQSPTEAEAKGETESGESENVQ